MENPDKKDEQFTGFPEWLERELLEEKDNPLSGSELDILEEELEPQNTHFGAGFPYSDYALI